jgi:hypothetical protein
MAGLPDGWIRLYDEVDPGLDAGQYRISAALDFTQAGGGALSAPPPESTYLEVVAPRFSLEPGEVVACHPPVGAQGAFATRLPHVVLGRRSLAWERRLAGGTPWMALLVFRKGEALISGPLPLRAAVGETVFARLAGSTPIEGDGPPVGVVTFQSGETLRKILPTPAEVALLCHARQVSLTDSAMAMGDDDGWFGVVTANRLPLAAGGPTSYVAALVSLEGHEDLWTLPAGAAAPPLVVLHSWEFTSSSGGTFEHLTQHLDCGLFGEPKAGTPPLAAEDGTLELPRTNRQGQAGPVWYRGPLSAAPPEERPAHSQEPGHISLDAAYELGRLLGAADGRFTRELVAWHRATDNQTVAAASLREVASALAAAPAALAPATAPTSLAGISEHLKQLAQRARRPADPWGVHQASVESLVRGLTASSERKAAPPELASAGGTPEPGARLSRLAEVRSAAAGTRRGATGDNNG